MRGSLPHGAQAWTACCGAGLMGGLAPGEGERVGDPPTTNLAVAS